MNRRALLAGVGCGLSFVSLPSFGDAQTTFPWSETLYLQFADEVQARSVLASALSLTFPADQPIRGSARTVLVPIVEWIVPPTITHPGTPRPGFWVMMKIRSDRAGYADAMAALSSYAQALDSPSNVFAGE